jgi:hypothetical protein
LDISLAAALSGDPFFEQALGSFDGDPADEISL